MNAVVAACLLLAAGVAEGHPFHVSLAEAEYDAERSRLEVALRVHPSDLEEALRRQAGKRLVLENDGADPHIVAWLRRNLVVETPQGKADIEWVGKEVSVKHAWLYFEIPLSGGLENVVFTNRIFFDLLPDQVNTINFKDGGRRTTLHFTRGEPRRTLSFEPAEEAAP
ncbi:MAG: hypothetical protein KY475_02520 [Planctomycetes bacterium]|nr:hypothetical protein [Planctomycetota bacterium]